MQMGWLKTVVLKSTSNVDLLHPSLILFTSFSLIKFELLLLITKFHIKFVYKRIIDVIF